MSSSLLRSLLGLSEHRLGVILNQGSGNPICLQTTSHEMKQIELDRLTTQLVGSVSLSPPQVRLAVDSLIDEQVRTENKADFLAALAVKGETIEEIGAFAQALLGRAVHPPLSANTRAEVILDVCGTGGDGQNTFNISTAAALVAAAAGLRVAKHGNRSVTSQTGSADVLEALGVPIDLNPAEAARSLEERHFAFFFAPNYHPVFKHIIPVRKLCAARGQRTIFNFLGPLLNPARPSAQLVGVPQPGLCGSIARVLQSLGVHRAMVVCGSTGNGFLDELSILGPTTITEFYQQHGFAKSVMSADDFPLQQASIADLRGGDREANARLILRLLEGDERGPKRDALLLNAAAALFVGAKSKTLGEGWDLASELIDSGKVRAKLRELATRR